MLDIGYFVNYNLDVLSKSFKQFQDYIKRKQAEKNAANMFLSLGGINERQAQILQMYDENPTLILTVKDFQGKFMITPTTAKNDLVLLMNRGLVHEIALNKVKKGYTKGDSFDEEIGKILKKQN